MKIYIAGPMTGLPQNNFPAFDAAATKLREWGHEVVSPAELDDPSDRALAMSDMPATKTWGDFLARDVKLIADGGIEAIAFLPGWGNSRGARLEAYIALMCGIDNFAVMNDNDLTIVGSGYVAHTLEDFLELTY